MVLADQGQTCAHRYHSLDVLDHPNAIACASQPMDQVRQEGATAQSSCLDPNTDEKEEEVIHLRQEDNLHAYPCHPEIATATPIGHWTVDKECLHRYSSVSP